MSMNKKNFDQLSEETVATEAEKQIKWHLKPSSDYLEDYFKSLGDGNKKFLGIETGMEKLDNKTLGLRNLIILGGPPKAGKTSLALQLSFDACQKGVPILFYSLEMTKNQLFSRILSRKAEVSYADILLKGGCYLKNDKQCKNLLGEDIDVHKLLTKEQIEKLKDATELLKKAGKRFYIREQSDSAEINFKAVEQEINFLKAKYKTDKVLVVVDHLQVFPIATNKYHDTLTKENALISKFNEISKGTEAAVVLISQMNKGGLSNPNAEALSDIKGSVDNVYLPHFIMNLKNENPNQKENDDEDAPKKMKLHITSRDTRGGMVALLFKGEYSAFSETVHDY